MHDNEQWLNWSNKVAELPTLWIWNPKPSWHSPNICLVNISFTLIIWSTYIQRHKDRIKWCTNKCTQRVQTPPRRLTSSKSNPGIKARFPDKSEFRSGCLPDCCQNTADSLPRQHQSFLWVPWNQTVNMRNDNKSPKISYSAIVREVEKCNPHGLLNGLMVYRMAPFLMTLNNP